MGKPHAHLHILRVKMGTGVYYTLIFLLPEQQSDWATPDNRTQKPRNESQIETSPKQFWDKEASGKCKT